jgi:hypothetical protein
VVVAGRVEAAAGAVEGLASLELASAEVDEAGEAGAGPEEVLRGFLAPRRLRLVACGVDVRVGDLLSPGSYSDSESEAPLLRLGAMALYAEY